MNVIVEIEKFVSGLSKSIYSSIEKAENSEEMVREENILTLTAPDITEFIQEMERLKARYQI
jgi:Zn-dependent oligopeptidase